MIIHRLVCHHLRSSLATQILSTFAENDIVDVDYLRNYEYDTDFLQVVGGAGSLADAAGCLSVFGMVAIGSCENHWPLRVAEAARDWLARITGWVIEIINLPAARSTTAARRLIQSAVAMNAECAEPSVTFADGSEPAGFDLPDTYFHRSACCNLFSAHLHLHFVCFNLFSAHLRLFQKTLSCCPP